MPPATCHPPPAPLALLCAGCALLAFAANPEEPKVFDLADEVVCRVNTEAISKAQVEERMEDVVRRLNAERKILMSAGRWNQEMQERYDKTYIPAFQEALRQAVRDKMMIHAAKMDKDFRVDERLYQSRLKTTLERIRQAQKKIALGEVEKVVREWVTLDTFRAQFTGVLDQPTRPEVQRYYQENIGRFQRPAGVKARIIRIDRFVNDPLTGKQKAQPDSYALAERLREDLVGFAANFANVAERHSNDEESKKRGGLIQLDPKDPYFNPDGYNAQLAAVLGGMNPGDISKAFEFGQSSYAFVLLEDRRKAGPAPLEGELFEEIYRTLAQQKSRKREDEWFRKQLTKSLVVHVVDGTPKTLPVKFFFPDDKDEPRKGEVVQEK